MLKRFFPLVFLLAAALPSCKVKYVPSSSQPIAHALFDSLLRAHVSPEGWVDYQGFIRDSSRLNAYLDLLSSNHPNDEHWSEAEQLVYWINAYNAFTIKLIVDHYPVESIKDIKRGIPFVNTVWDLKFIRIEDALYDLNNIEHGIIRTKFDEPRIHFAVNCASYSCPKLLNAAYTAESLDAQLEAAARAFINDPRRNRIAQDRLQLSRILSWYRADFKAWDSITDLVRQYSDQPIGPNPEVEYLEYDWRLNEVGRQ